MPLWDGLEERFRKPFPAPEERNGVRVHKKIARRESRQARENTRRVMRVSIPRTDQDMQILFPGQHETPLNETRAVRGSSSSDRQRFRRAVERL
jgi:hypothetical protein